VLGYSFLEENADKVAPVSIAGVAPTEATISDLSYPGSRKLYIYVKGEHIAAKPAIKRLHRRLCQGVGQGRPLEKRGLVPFGGADATAPRAGDGAQAARPGEPEVSGRRRAHDAHLALVAVLAIAARRLASPARARRGLRTAARGSTACPIITALYVALWAALPALLFLAAGRRSSRGWSTRRCSPAPAGPGAARVRDAARHDPREARDRAAAIAKPASIPNRPRSRRAMPRPSAQICDDRRRRRDRHRAGRRLLRAAPDQAPTSAPAAGSSAG
jgi:hypothetical protein